MTKQEADDKRATLMWLAERLGISYKHCRSMYSKMYDNLKANNSRKEAVQMPKTYPYEPPTRTEYLTAKYGECLTRAKAATILGVSTATITQMTRDGRLEAVCEGRRISTQSIARYMDRPAQEDFKARLRRQGKDPSRCVLPS